MQTLRILSTVRRRNSGLSLFCLFVFCFSVLLLAPELGKIQGHHQQRSGENQVLNHHKKMQPSEMIIATTICGDRAAEELLVLVKSALYFSNVPLKFIVFADDSSLEYLENLTEQSNFKRPYLLNNYKFDWRPIELPDSNLITADEWMKVMKLHKRCASQKLFIPSLLEEVDSLLYMDTDTIFLTPPERIWQHHFNQMNDSHLVAVSLQNEEDTPGWYHDFSSRIPFYGNSGLNTGVMLMNLTRMRQFSWQQKAIGYYKEFEPQIDKGDQDVINILFHYNPERLFVLPCHYNYRPEFCDTRFVSIPTLNTCDSAEEHGVFILHGDQSAFHPNSSEVAFPAFAAVYNSVKKFDSSLPFKHFNDEIKVNIESAGNTSCGKQVDLFTKAFYTSSSPLSRQLD